MKRQLDAARGLRDLVRSQELQARPDALRLVRDAIGIDLMIRSVNRGLALGRLQIPDRLLAAVFGGSDVDVMHRCGQSKPRDLAWELLVGSTISVFADGVEFEEPDLVAKFRGARIGIACKCLYQDPGQRMEEPLVKGAKQIERSQVDYGLVFTNLSNLVTHVSFLGSQPGFAQGPVFRDLQEPRRRLQQQVGFVLSHFNEKSLSRRMSTDKSGHERARTRGVVFCAQTPVVVGAELIRAPLVTFYDFREIELENVNAFVAGASQAVADLAHWRILEA